jgi:hypothetical protein
MRLKGKKRHRHRPKSAEEIADSGEKPVEIKGLVLTFYSRFLGKALQHRMVVLLISFALLILYFQIWLLVVGLEKPVEFFPNIDPGSMYVNIDPPQGADLEYIDRIVRKVEMAANGVIHQDKQLPLHLYNTSYTPKHHQKAGGELFQGPGDLDNIEYIYAKAVETAGGLSA